MSTLEFMAVGTVACVVSAVVVDAVFRLLARKRRSAGVASEIYRTAAERDLMEALAGLSGAEREPLETFSNVVRATSRSDGSTGAAHQ